MNLAVILGGLANGAVYALVAVGLVLIFRATGVLNFAQGALMMVGAYAYYEVSRASGTSIVQLLVVLAVGVVAGLVFFIVTHVLMKEGSELAAGIVTLALFIMLQTTARLLYSDDPRSVHGWLVGDRNVGLPDGTELPINSILIMVVTAVVCIGLYAFFRYTMYGKAITAVAADARKAAATGIPVGFMLAASWALGGALAALGGLLLSPVTQVEPAMGDVVLFPAIFAAVAGGFRSLLGALVGGLVIGLLETASVVLVGGTFQQVATFVVLLALLVVRPQGLFTEAKAREF